MVYAVPFVHPRALCILGKHCTNRATASARNSQFISKQFHSPPELNLCSQRILAVSESQVYTVYYNLPTMTAIHHPTPHSNFSLRSPACSEISHKPLALISGDSGSWKAAAMFWRSPNSSEQRLYRETMSRCAQPSTARYNCADFSRRFQPSAFVSHTFLLVKGQISQLRVEPPPFFPSYIS